MKSDGRQSRTIALAIFVFFIVATTTHCQPFALLTLSNAIPTNSSALTNGEPASKLNNLPSNGADEVIPIVMNEIPIGTATENLARYADINHLFDPRLLKWWAFRDSDGNATHEPIVTFRSMNLNARQALIKILKERNLVLAEDPVTSIARITYINQVVNPIDVSLLGSDTNIIPLISYQDVPITIGMDNLAHQLGFNYVFDPKIGYGQPDKSGQIKIEPTLNIYWRNVTAQQAFVAICQNYDFVVAKNPGTSILLISEKNHPITNFVDASLLGSDANEFIPIQIMGDMTWQGQACSDTNAIQIQDVPLAFALTQLAKVAQIKIVLDPRLSEEPTISVRWWRITPKQAIVALCDNYDLIIVKNSETGVIQIKPKD